MLLRDVLLLHTLICFYSPECDHIQTGPNRIGLVAVLQLSWGPVTVMRPCII